MRLSATDRFWSKVEKRTDGCWAWTGAVGKVDGYGRFGVGPRGAHVTFLAHRFSYLMSVGAIEPGLQLDHLCRNRRCVNPVHLEPVTQAENIRRGLAGENTGKINRAKTHCPNGHEYSSGNTYVRNGSRTCKECHRKKTRMYMARQRKRS